jgi:hypothetical protein
MKDAALFDHMLGLLLTLMRETVGASETSVNMYQTTSGRTPEDSLLQNRML